MTTATTIATGRAAAIEPRSVRFTDTLGSEWVKLTTLRSTYITLGLGVALSIAMTAVVCMATGSTFDSWSAARQAEFSPLLMTMAGNVVALITFSVFGVLVASGEYSSGMIRLSVAATPKRGRVLVSKLLLVSSITTLLGLITTVGMFLVGQAVLGAYGVPVTDLGDPNAQRLVFGLGAATALFPVLGLALAVALRSTAGAITAVLGLLWLPQVFGELLPEWAGEHVLRLFAQSGADSMTVAHLAESPIYSDPAVGAAIVVVWLVAFVGAAYVLLARRDA